MGHVFNVTESKHDEIVLHEKATASERPARSNSVSAALASTVELILPTVEVAYVVPLP